MRGEKMFFFFFDFSIDDYDKLTDYQKFISFYEFIIQKNAFISNFSIKKQVEISKDIKVDLSVYSEKNTRHYIFRRDIDKKYLEKFSNSQLSNNEQLLIISPKLVNKDFYNKHLDFKNILLSPEIHNSYINNNKLDAITYLDIDNLSVSDEDFNQQTYVYKVFLKRILEEQTSCYTLVLGAGVSKDYGVKMWNPLLKTYFTHINTPLKYNEDYIYEKIGNTSLIKAQFIVDNFSSKKNIDSRELDFCKDMRSKIYPSSVFRLKMPSTLNSIVNFVDRYITTNEGIITYN
jgi:hypothetical protein